MRREEKRNDEEKKTRGKSMKVRVENAERRRMKNENEEEGERECRKRKKGKKGKGKKGKLSGDSSTVPGDVARPINTQVCIVQLQLCATRTHKHTLSNCVPREHTKTHFVQL